MTLYPGHLNNRISLPVDQDAIADVTDGRKNWTTMTLKKLGDCLVAALAVGYVFMKTPYRPLLSTRTRETIG